MAQANPIPATAEVALLTKFEELKEPGQQKMLGEYASGSIDIESTVYRILADVRERYGPLEQVYLAEAGERAILRREAQERIQSLDLTKGPTYVACGPDGQPLVEPTAGATVVPMPAAAIPAAVAVAALTMASVPEVKPMLINPPAASEDQDEEESAAEESAAGDGMADTSDTSDDQQHGKQALIPRDSRHLSLADEHEIEEEDENAGFTEPGVDESFDYEES